MWLDPILVLNLFSGLCLMEGVQKVRKTSPLNIVEVQNEPSCFQHSGGNLSMAGSRLGQWLMYKGFKHMNSISINSAHCQSLTEDLLQQGVPPPWLKKGLLV